ncbi:hypothetical protein MVEN_00247000 [Mycena venus]|uniref:Uncharacterized protein n=1 Tax=Mycena venus TaxID=2733690 RepID=A0A8H6Z2J4_9AGAR|nr:hypothetical protein MVEN_00247000 [Mycena venus]
MPAKKTAKRARSPDAGVNEKDTGSTSVRPQKRPKEVSASKDAAKNNSPSEAAAQTPESPSLSGKFDVYQMDLAFLSDVYLPTGTSEPQFEKLYKKIAPFTKDGQLEERGSCDPMEEMPFDIAIKELKLIDKLTFSPGEQSRFITTPQSGPGITGRLELADSNCGIQSAAGVFRMKHVWTGKGVEGRDVEIFEGYMSFKVAHSGLYKRKGHGSGNNRVFAFWAVRGRRDADGEEIGLTERN